MKCNVGEKERIARIVAGAVIIILGVVFHSMWGAIGLIPLATGFLRWCPAYDALGINTSK
jgi:hypothetical protein